MFLNCSVYHAVEPFKILLFSHLFLITFLNLMLSFLNCIYLLTMKEGGLKEGKTMKKFLIYSLYENDDFKDSGTSIAKGISNSVWSM